MKETGIRMSSFWEADMCHNGVTFGGEWITFVKRILKSLAIKFRS